MTARALTTAAVVLLCALPAQAQQAVSLQFNQGLVTLRAQNAPIRAILAEWARLGGATIVNGDRVAGAPITLELTGVPESQALDIVLRNVAGYMLAPRRAGSAGASTFVRILILPTSAAPRNPPPAAATAAAGARPVLPRPGVPPPPRPTGAVVEFPDDTQADNDTGEPDAQGNQTRPPGPQRVIPQPLARRPPQVPGTDPQVEPDDADESGEPGITTVGQAPSPANPFGIPAGSSTRPGVIAPVPRPQPQQPQPNRVQ